MKKMPVEEVSGKHALRDIMEVITDQKKGRHSNGTGSSIKGRVKIGSSSIIVIYDGKLVAE